MGPLVEQCVDKLLERNSHAKSGYTQISSEAIAGCSERPISHPSNPGNYFTRPP